MNRIAAVAAALLVTARPAAALDQATFEAVAGDVYRPVMERFALPGLAVGLTLDGRSYTFFAGSADSGTGAPVTADTLFELGSVSKLFNVALAARAEGRGLLAMADRVRDHRPAFAGTPFGALGLSDLATHLTGGLPLQVPDGLDSAAALDAWLARWEPTAARPDETRSYSNVSIGMLGAITAETMGTSYADALEGTLLPELGLRSTFVRVPEDRLPDYAMGTTRNGSPARVGPGLLDDEAYGLKSTVADMTRFLSAHLGTTSIAPETAAALARTRTVFADTAHFAQAMVWEGYPWPAAGEALAKGNAPGMAMEPQPVVRRVAPAEPEGAIFWSKTGSTGGFGAYVALVPSESLGLVVLANRGYPNPVRVEAAVQLIERLLAAEGRPVVRD